MAVQHESVLDIPLSLDSSPRRLVRLPAFPEIATPVGDAERIDQMKKSKIYMFANLRFELTRRYATTGSCRYPLFNKKTSSYMGHKPFHFFLLHTRTVVASDPGCSIMIHTS